METLKREWKSYVTLLHSVPSLVTSVFVLSVVCMNLLASRELYRSEYFCINCGLALSWISFLCMDCICKRFGAKAAFYVSFTAMIINILTTLCFKLLCMTPGRWAAYYSAADDAAGTLIHNGIDQTFSSSWYVVAGSALAMLASALVNGVMNQAIGRIADRGGFSGFAARSLISTCIAQWVDNFVFSILVSYVFFGWTITQVLICSTTSMVIELVAEAIFSPLGYKISKGWEEKKVGEKYIKETLI